MAGHKFKPSSGRVLRSDPKAAWQGDESCVLMYPVYYETAADRIDDDEQWLGRRHC